VALVFLSCASADLGKARQIAEELRRAGHTPWIAEDEVLVGESIPSAVARGLAAANFVVACLSSAANKSGWVEAELAATVMRQFKERTERVLPVRLDAVPPPESIHYLSHADLFPGTEGWRRGVDRLLESIRQYDARRGKAPSSAPSPPKLSELKPQYPNEETRALSERLERARERKQKLREVGADTAEVDREILDLRRQIREGGQLRPGDSFGDGRFLLLEKIGRGGFATVYKAFDRERAEHVAVKVLHSELAGDEIRRERLFRGARAMASLEHEAIVRVTEPYGEDGGYYYYVMEFISGGDLRRAILDKKIAPGDVMRVVLHVGEALAEVHAKGFIHRDVRPANILMHPSGLPKLSDFDLVGGKDTTGGTRTGALGTFIYAAPELLQRPQDADAAADVYGLGLTAVAGLHGAEPTMFDIFELSQLIDRLSCSNALKAVLKQAVDRDSRARFADAGSFCKALRDAISARQIRGGGQLRPGDSLRDGRFRLLKTICQSGFATVYKAFDRERAEHVAVKVLRSELAGDEIRRERLFRGARAMASLEHEAIVRVTEPYGEDGGYYYYVMEFISGGDLLDAILNKKIAPGDVMRVVLHVGEALAEVHAKGFIHRDVRPANILMHPSGLPKLSNFDLVGGEDTIDLVGDEETTGETWTRALGRFLYVPPELLERPQDADAAADVYGLGLTAVAGLHGAEPTRDDIFKLSQLIDRLFCSDALKAVLKQAVDRDSRARFADAGSFCKALRDAISAERGNMASALPVKEVLLRADRLRRQRDYPQALSLLQAAIHAKPEQHELREKLFDVLVESGDRERALKEMLLYASRLAGHGYHKGAALILDEMLLLEPGHSAATEMLAQLGYAITYKDGVEVQEMPRSARLLSQLDEEAMEEADFFARHGMFEQALAMLSNQLTRNPNHPLILDKMREVEDLRARAPENAKPPSSAVHDISASLEALGQLEMGDQLERGDSPARDVESMFEQFKHGASPASPAQVSESDAATHYDLGVAYKEMGLFTDAIAEFELASRDWKRGCACLLNIGKIYVQTGEIDASIGAFMRGLQARNKTREQELTLTYEVANAHEMLGLPEQAIMFFERLAARDPDFQDARGSVAERMQRLAPKKPLPS
jgi:serine/threonine protein kinase